MLRILVTLPIFLCFFISDLFGNEKHKYQDNPDNMNIEELIGGLINNSNDQNSLEYYLMIFENYNANKLNLKSVSLRELEQIPFISKSSAKTVFNVIKRNNVTSFNEIEQLNIITKKELFILRYCSKFINKDVIGAMYKINSIIPFYNEKGIVENKYLGDKYSVSQKFSADYHTNNSKYALNFNTKKSIGELHFVEHYTGSINYSNNNIQLLLGDYYISSGMNSLLSSGFNAKKGFDYSNLYKIKQTKITANNSFFSNNYFRGIALAHIYSFNNNKEKTHEIETNIFYSNKFKSASYDTENDIITSINDYEKYQLSSHLEKIGVVKEELYGINTNYLYSDFLLGFNLVHVGYNIEINTESNNDFSGKSGLISSIYSQYSFANSDFLFEISSDNNKNMGIKAVINTHFDRNFSHQIAFRNYDANLSIPYSNNEGEFSNMANEIGLYNGFEYTMSDFDLSAYVDLYQSQTRTYFIPAIVKGVDFLSTLRYDLGNSEIVLKYKNENKTDSKFNDSLFIHQKRFNRLNLKYYFELFEESRVKLEAEYVNLILSNNESNENGYFIGVEVKQKILNNLELKISNYYYDTDSYESGIWKFEYYYPHYSRIPKYYGNGNSTMINLKYNIMNSLELWIVYKNDIVFDRNSWGNGNTLINNNIKDLLYIQVRLSLQ